MNKIIPFHKIKNKLWACIFYIQNQRHIANIYDSYQKAQQDCQWRTKEVQAYKHLLIKSNQPVPHYMITPIHRSELPKNWKPLPALGFLLTTRYPSKRFI